MLIRQSSVRKSRGVFTASSASISITQNPYKYIILAYSLLEYVRGILYYFPPSIQWTNNYLVHCAKSILFVNNRSLWMTFNLQNKEKTEIFWHYSFLWFCDLAGRCLLNEAFASKLPEKIFVCFEVPNSCFKVGHLTQKHPVCIILLFLILKILFC